MQFKPYLKSILLLKKFIIFFILIKILKILFFNSFNKFINLFKKLIKVLNFKKNKKKNDLFNLSFIDNFVLYKNRILFINI